MGRFVTYLSLLCCASLTVSWLTGCSEEIKTNSSSVPGTTLSSGSAKPAPEKVELKSYEFPEFLNTIKSPDMLSNPVLISFDANAAVSGVTSQPFEDLECVQLVEDAVYIFAKDGFKGVCDLNGKVLLEADTYTDIKPCSNGMLMLSRNKELNSPDDYAYFNEFGSFTMIDRYRFVPDDIVIDAVPAAEETEDTEEERMIYDLILPGNVTAGSGTEFSGWDRLEPMPVEELDTVRAYSAYYRAQKDGSFYIIGVDKYYNYTVYNGTYGMVKLRVGNDYGVCYILDYNDYTELDKMLQSFGDSNEVKAPSKDENLDFIQIEMGTAPGTTTTVTVSADGFCLTDRSAVGDNPSCKFFSMLDKESFVSLVQWVDQVLSKEYQGRN
ncbi:MAG: hypothetical protein IJ806_11635 [Ruminococcus sp.]|nr:hypothetical protein [Ruminococcus sp.]